MTSEAIILRGLGTYPRSQRFPCLREIIPGEVGQELAMQVGALLSWAGVTITLVWGAKAICYIP